MRQKRIFAKFRVWSFPRLAPFRFSDGSSLIDLPSPKFKIGQVVCCEWINEDNLDIERHGKLMQDYGVVTGFCYDHKDYRETTWVYQVHWVKMSDSSVPTPDQPYIETVLESELRLAIKRKVFAS